MNNDMHLILSSQKTINYGEASYKEANNEVSEKISKIDALRKNDAINSSETRTLSQNQKLMLPKIGMEISIFRRGVSRKDLSATKKRNLNLDKANQILIGSNHKNRFKSLTPEEKPKLMTDKELDELADLVADEVYVRMTDKELDELADFVDHAVVAVQEEKYYRPILHNQIEKNKMRKFYIGAKRDSSS